jgi:hypothetical protein
LKTRLLLPKFENSKRNNDPISVAYLPLLGHPDQEGGGENLGDVAADEGMIRQMTSENVYHPAADHENKSAGERSACPFCFLDGIG